MKLPKFMGKIFYLEHFNCMHKIFFSSSGRALIKVRYFVSFESQLPRMNSCLQFAKCSSKNQDSNSIISLEQRLIFGFGLFIFIVSLTLSTQQ